MGRGSARTEPGEHDQTVVAVDTVITVLSSLDPRPQGAMCGARLQLCRGDRCSIVMAVRGWLFYLSGRASDAIPIIVGGITAYRSTGATQSLPVLLSSLASAYAEMGKFEDAQRCIDEAIVAIEIQHLCTMRFSANSLVAPWRSCGARDDCSFAIFPHRPCLPAQTVPPRRNVKILYRFSRGSSRSSCVVLSIDHDLKRSRNDWPSSRLA